jgi:hypothetical protein
VKKVEINVTSFSDFGIVFGDYIDFSVQSQFQNGEAKRIEFLGNKVSIWLEKNVTSWWRKKVAPLFGEVVDEKWKPSAIIHLQRNPNPRKSDEI